MNASVALVPHSAVLVAARRTHPRLPGRLPQAQIAVAQMPRPPGRPPRTTPTTAASSILVLAPLVLIRVILSLVILSLGRRLSPACCLSRLNLVLVCFASCSSSCSSVG